MRIYYDIETVANQRWREHVADLELEPKVSTKPPKKITDLTTEKLRNERLNEWSFNLAVLQEADIAKQRQDMLDGAALNWWSGQVCSIAVKMSNQEWCWPGADEKKILDRFAFEVDTWWMPEQSRLIGKYAQSFDRPFLIGRYMALDLGVPEFLRWPYKIEDIHDIFGRYSKNKCGKLEQIAFGLGIDGKAGSWDQVEKWFQEENWDDMGKYNLQDVELCQTIMSRYSKKWTGA